MRCSICGEKIMKEHKEAFIYEKCSFCSYEGKRSLEPMEENVIKKYTKRAWEEYENREAFQIRYRDSLTGAEMKGRFKIGENLLIEDTFVFEHTNEPRDWVTNFFACTKKVRLMGKEIYFHRGYYLAAKRLLDRFSHGNTAKMFLSGYSMGAGVASIFAILYAAENPGCEVVCVAMEGANYFSGKVEIENLDIINVENGNDTVTKVPWWLGKYGEVINIGEKRRWCKTGIKLRYDKIEKGLYKFFDVPEHHFGEYKKSLDVFLGGA